MSKKVKDTQVNAVEAVEVEATEVTVVETETKGAKITGKMDMAMKAVKELGGEAFASQVLTYLDEKYADRTELKTFNSVNATLAAVAGKGLVKKSKGVLGEKLLTKYALVDGE